MALDHLLGTSFSCKCGKSHVVPTRYLVYSAAVFEAMPTIIKEVSGAANCVVIADDRTYRVAGKQVEDRLKESGIETTGFIVPDDKGEPPAANDRYRDLILSSTPAADIYVAVGSGVINDLVKWTSYLRETPYMVFATAASMNGYASANVAATIDGLKVLFHADAPLAVFTHPDIIVGAPLELTTSGLGDVLAKSVSSADWKLNRLLFDDYYCQFSIDLLKDLEPIYLNNSQAIKNREEQSFRALFEALFYSSIAMTITGTSSPASGGEHLISHTLDIVAGRDGKNHDLHGRQVGVGSVLMAGLYELVLNIDQPSFILPPNEINSAFWGDLSGVVAKEYETKLPRMEQAVDTLSSLEKWNELRTILKPGLISAAALKNCLEQAGAAHSFTDIRLDGQSLNRAYFEDVVNMSNQMRSRFTVLDLATLMGILPERTSGLVDLWVG